MMTVTRYVHIKGFAESTGTTEKAVRRKIERGIFIEGRHYRRAPDGRIYIDLREYEKWVENRAR